MKRKLLRKCIHALEELCKEVGISKYQLKDMIFGQGLSIWAQMYLEMGAYCCGINSECYIDLSLKEKDILERIRRTNKYSIQKADKLWKSEIITKENGRDRVEKCFERFRELHFEVSGRTTRSKKTWEIQCESVLNKNNFVILLYDIEDNLIGASLFRVSGSVGLYSVAAYKRELFKKPVGHISQWIAIKHMKELGLKWYYIGRRSYLGDWDHPSEKEISIGHFKEGFATNIYPRVFLEYNMDNNHFEVS